MEKQTNQEELERFFVPRHEFEKEKNEIYKDIDKKSNRNRDRIQEVDTKHTENFHQLQRNLDQYTSSMDSLNESVKSLNSSVNEMSNSLSSNIQDLKNVTDRVSKTESNISEQDLIKKERKIAMIKLVTGVVTSIIGAGGLLSWLGPLIFK
ncbi:putative membrane protein [Staphylococcus phage VB-SauS-SA2]|nr:putative membrane protein [Staphylococcus phage VB-SauS-SA2]